jgi:hypothetical protein
MKGSFKALSASYEKSSYNLECAKSLQAPYVILCALQFDNFDERHALVDYGQITNRHKALDYELYLLDLYARYWYCFKAGAPFKLKKRFYLL